MKTEKNSLNPYENICNLFESSNNLILEAQRMQRKASEAMLSLIKNIDNTYAEKTLTNINDFYTIDEVCTTLNVSKSTIYNMIRSKIIQSNKISGKLLFSKIKISYYLNSL